VPSTKTFRVLAYKACEELAASRSSVAEYSKAMTVCHDDKDRKLHVEGAGVTVNRRLEWRGEVG